MLNFKRLAGLRRNVRPDHPGDLVLGILLGAAVSGAAALLYEIDVPPMVKLGTGLICGLGGLLCFYAVREPVPQAGSTDA